MRLPKRITVRWLRANNACEPQVKVFKEVFPSGADITNRNIATALRHDLHLGFLAKRIKGTHYGCGCNHCVSNAGSVIREAYDLPRPRK